MTILDVILAKKFGGGGGDYPVYTLHWFSNPTEEQKQANVSVLSSIRSLTPGSYTIVIVIGSYSIPAIYVNSGGRGSVIGLSVQDGKTLRAYQFTGATLSHYQQFTWDYLEGYVSEWNHAAKELLIAILRAGVYTSDQKDNIDALEEILNSSNITFVKSGTTLIGHGATAITTITKSGTSLICS